MAFYSSDVVSIYSRYVWHREKWRQNQQSGKNTGWRTVCLCHLWNFVNATLCEIVGSFQFQVIGFKVMMESYANFHISNPRIKIPCVYFTQMYGPCVSRIMQNVMFSKHCLRFNLWWHLYLWPFRSQD